MIGSIINWLSDNWGWAIGGATTLFAFVYASWRLYDYVVIKIKRKYAFWINSIISTIQAPIVAKEVEIMKGIEESRVKRDEISDNLKQFIIESSKSFAELRYELKLTIESIKELRDKHEAQAEAQARTDLLLEQYGEILKRRSRSKE